MNHDNPYKQAEVKTRALRDFYIHLAIFLPASFGLFLLELLMGGSGRLGLALILVWGLGLALHAVSLLRPFQRLSRLLDRIASPRE